jgi:hypothetical protein
MSCENSSKIAQSQKNMPSKTGMTRIERESQELNNAKGTWQESLEYAHGGFRNISSEEHAENEEPTNRERESRMCIAGTYDPNYPDLDGPFHWLK